MIDDITILIHTFRRPQALQRLKKSIGHFYPKAKVLIYDDSEYDRGLSWGRNYLVSEAKTKYIFLCDDDFIFTEQTNLLRLLASLIKDNVDIMGASVNDIYYHGVYKTEGNTVTLLPAEKELDFIPNCFLAKRDILLKYKWDERLKLGEHFAYFYEHRGKIRIGFNPRVVIGHIYESSIRYAEMRGRAKDYVFQYMREKGINKKIDLNGEILEVPDVI
jgi:glycosyltransferase involved in cell wall biosynthesis